MASELDQAFNKSYLSPDYKNLATDMYNSTVQPLEQDFTQKTLPQLTENLATRGIQFGGLGSDSYARTLNDFNRVKGNVASTIATNLGQTALDQAFKTNEAAIQREFEKSQQTSQNEFNAGESALTRGLTEKQITNQENQFGQSLSFDQQKFAEDVKNNGLDYALKSLQTKNQAIQFEQSMTFDKEKFAEDVKNNGLDYALKQLQTQNQASQFSQTLNQSEKELASKENQSELDRALTGSEGTANRSLDQLKLTQQGQQYLQSTFLPLVQSGAITPEQYATITGQTIATGFKDDTALALESGMTAQGLDPNNSSDVENYRSYLRNLPEQTAKQQIQNARASANLPMFNTKELNDYYTQITSNQPAMQQSENENAMKLLQDQIKLLQEQLQNNNNNFLFADNSAG